MKPRKLRFFPRTLMVCVAPLLACHSAHATVAATNESNGSGVWNLPPGTNLLAGTAPLTAAASHEGSSTIWGTLTDGGLGDLAGSAATSVTPNNGDTVTFPLDLTGHPTGYNITSFDSYCTWGNSGRDDQNYMLQYSTVANPTTFINIATVGLHTGNDRSTHTRLTDDTGFLATGVHSVRVIFNRQENGYVGYREFVLQDTPVIACVDNQSRPDVNWPPLVGPNLLAGIVPADPAPGSQEGSSNSWSTVTDGSISGDVADHSFCITPGNQSVTYPLDLLAKPAGYDITSFESFAAWQSNGRDDQTYTLEYSVVGAPTTFLPIKEIYNHTEFNGPNSSVSTRTRVTGNGGPIATGVAAIRLTFHNQENGYTGFREFVLRDTPLPTSIVKESNTTNSWTLPAGTNLLSSATTITPAVAANSNHGNGDVTSSEWSVLTDGSIGSAGVQLQSVAPLNNTSVVFALDTMVNFNGYNFSSFDSYCAWGDSGRDDQSYTLSYATVDAPGVYIPVETLVNRTLPPNNATHTRITSPAGYLATRVGEIKLDFFNQENGYVGYRQLVAQGSAVPLSPPLTWTGLDGAAGNADWVTTVDNNWADMGVSAPFNSLAPLSFDDTGINTNINIPTGLSADSLTFTNDSVPYTFGGDVLTVTNGLFQAGTGDVVFDNVLTANALSVTGAGSLTLGTDNTLSGVATVSNGVLNLMSDSSLGTSALTLTGGIVNIMSELPVISTISGTGGSVFLGNAGVPSDTELYLGNSASTTYAGSISDASVSATGSLLKVGSGTLTLTGTNSYSGPTTVLEGELKLGKRQSLYNGNTASWTAANIQVYTNLTLKVGGVGEFTSADLAALDSGGFGFGSVLGLDTTSGSYSITDSFGGDQLLEKQGINSLTLSGTNSFSSGITVAQGSLIAANPGGVSIPSDLTLGNVTFDAFANMGNDNQFGPNSLIWFNTGPGAVNGKFQLRGTSQTVAGLESGTGNRIAIIQNDEIGSPGYTANPGVCSLTIDTAENAVHSFYGIIRNQDGGALSLVKTGLGTQELKNAAIQSHSYNGPTSVNEGTLRINFAGGNTGFGSNITVASGATLEFIAVGGDYNFDRELHGEGTIAATGVNALRFTNTNNSFTNGLTIGSPGIGTYNGFVAFAAQNGVVQGAGNGPDQTCIGGAMTPTNVITVQGGATLALDGIGPLGESSVLPDFAPSIVVSNSGLRGGGLAFVPNLTLNNAEVTVGDGIVIAGFDTSLCFVGTVTVGGDSLLPSIITTPNPGPAANVSLGSAGLPGTIFDVTDVTGTPDVDLDVDAVVRNLNGVPSPLTKTGAGTMLLRQINTYTGDTTVSGGELTVSGGQSIVDTNKLVLDGGKLGLVDDETVGTLYYGGVLQNSGTYGSTSSTADNQDDGRFSGTGVLTVTTGPAVPYETWALIIPNAADRDRTDDPDGDGFTNLDEFLFGTSPVENTASLSTFEDTGSGLIVRWNERANSTSVYELQESTTLVNPWDASTAPITDNAVQDVPDYVRKEATVPVDNAKKFVRVQATE